jgi:diaminohydroxyphosphoribosylaminopyrimidine deaminase/5-amino-6-(5-phosphoribosylamino)uracil reductase
MRRALQIAARGRGRTSPNPMVGATVVTPEGVIVGDGWHQQAGSPHAEIHALAAAGRRAEGATLYCTLEPCCHHGRTGPCVEAIVKAGIAQVVAAIDDPNPLVKGQGFRHLESHGIKVVRDVARAEAARLNAPFLTAMRERRPWVIAKAGVSADGKVAAAAGVRTPITSAASRRHAQRRRAEVDAIAVGIETVLVDDPLLTVRDVYRMRPLTRVVFDRSLKTPSSARLLTTLAAGPVVIVGGPDVAETGRAARLREAGAVVAVADGTVAGALRVLAGLGIQSLLVEGGPRLQGAFAEAGMIDEVEVYIAQGVTLPGGVPLAPAGFPLAGLADLEAVPVGDDVLVRGYVHRPH